MTTIYVYDVKIVCRPCRRCRCRHRARHCAACLTLTALHSLGAFCVLCIMYQTTRLDYLCISLDSESFSFQLISQV